MAGTSIAATSTVYRTNRKSSFARQEAIYGYAFLLPWLIGLLVFVLGPMVASLGLSFTVYGIVKPPEFIGFDNYIRMFTNDVRFWPSIEKTVYWAVSYVPLAIFGALLVAILLNQGLRFTSIYRTVFFLPHLTPTVASIFIWLWLLSPKFGLLNEMIWQTGYKLTGEGWVGPSWLADKDWAIPSLVAIALWGALGGNGMMIFLAGLQGVPKELYEAAEIDGANSIQRFWNITIPMISPTLFFNLVLGLIGALQAFENAFVATAGGPAYATYFYALHIYNQAFLFGEYGYGAALAVFSFICLVSITALNFKLSQRWVYYARRGEGMSATAADASMRAHRSIHRRGSASRYVLNWASLHLLTVVIGFILMVPFAWALISSFKPIWEIRKVPPVFWPSEFNWTTYPELFNHPLFGYWVRNTFYISVLATIGTIISAALAGYAFARFRFPGRGILFGLTLSTIMLPDAVRLIPTFLLYYQLGWLNTHLPLIVPFFFGGGAFYIFLFRQFFMSLPNEMDEAAKIDGAGYLQILFLIVVPLSLPVMATVGIIAFIGYYNSFLFPLIILKDANLFTMSIGLRYFNISPTSDAIPKDNLLLGMAVVMTLPIMLLFFVGQRYFVQGVVMSGIKG